MNPSEGNAQIERGGVQGTVRWGIVGTGVIAGRFAADLPRARNAVLTAVTSRSSANVARFVASHGGVAYDTLTQMLSADMVDAVYVATPNTTHFGIALAAMEAGKAVLVEKPLAATSAEAEELALFAASRGVFLMEAMWTRFLPAIAFVRSALRDGTLGEIRHVTADLSFLKAYDPKSRFFDPMLGGGALLDLGVYPVSLCLDLFGLPDEMHGTWQPAPSGVDLSATISMRFGRTMVELSCGFDRLGDNRLIIEGSKATLVVQPPFIAARTIIEGRDGPALRLARISGRTLLARAAGKLVRSVKLPGLKRHAFGYDGHGLQFEADAVAEALSKGWSQHAIAPHNHSIKTLQIIEKVLKPVI
ncbi:MAG: Gfo/Idh/MocA family oxidoreductase [Hyphomicrobiales bacterium]|nr:Gfo/Idh/MocA family oxidoreductase [Hyphomicrobiales bacterium]